MAKLYPISTAHNHDEVYAKIGEGGVSDHGALTGLEDNDHPQYLLTTGKAADADKLDGIDSTGFVQTSGNQTVAGIKTFSSIPVLPATNPTTANQAVRKGFADATYLGIAAKAADADKLDGLDSTDFAREIAYRVSAYRDNTAFSLTTSGTIYAIPLNQETYDTHGFHDNTTNPTRLTCQKAGTYIVTGQVSFAANATGNRDTLLRVNGTDYVGMLRLPAAASGSTSVPVTAIATLNANDYIELCGRQYSGGSLDLYYANSISNYLTIVRIAP